MDSLNPIESAAVESPYEMLLRAASLLSISHYILGFLLTLIVFLYNFLEIHFLQDLFTGLRGQPVVLTFNPCSQVYQEVVSKCRIFRGRQIFMASDGGTLALDWVTNREVKKQAFQTVRQDEKSPIMIIVPRLTNASDSALLPLTPREELCRSLCPATH